jgi:hypothetical protein
MVDQPEIRIGDVDRRRTIDLLTQAYGEGRLQLAEFEERVSMAESAKVQSDLAPLLNDLPVPRQPDPPMTPAAVGRSVQSRFRREYGVFFIAPVICTVIYLMTNAGGYFWPMWVWFGCMIPVVLAVVFDNRD